ncbi:hypothetical protein K438DRAFT_1984010 [Mycena galopus ATCC 62051]|nr:hypothetical protein K438DRAFT_1984010 [Mycena galopus ATCC 62051]
MPSQPGCYTVRPFRGFQSPDRPPARPLRRFKGPQGYSRTPPGLLRLYIRAASIDDNPRLTPSWRQRARFAPRLGSRYTGTIARAALDDTHTLDTVPERTLAPPRTANRMRSTQPCRSLPPMEHVPNTTTEIPDHLEGGANRSRRCLRGLSIQTPYIRALIASVTSDRHGSPAGTRALTRTRTRAHGYGFFGRLTGGPRPAQPARDP